jgi:hypothetical protein
VQAIKDQLEVTTSEYDREKMQERLAKLKGTFIKFIYLQTF